MAPTALLIACTALIQVTVWSVIRASSSQGPHALPQAVTTPIAMSAQTRLFAHSARRDSTLMALARHVVLTVTIALQAAVRSVHLASTMMLEAVLRHVLKSLFLKLVSTLTVSQA